MKKMNTKAGTVRHRPPANRNWSGESESCCTSAAGRVGLRSVRITATNTSFHDVTNANSAAAARPGTLLGSTTRSTAPTRLVPSDMAASSHSAGTRRKTLAVIRMVSGSVIAPWTSATDQTVSFRFHSMNVTSSGIEMMTMGIARTLTSSSCVRSLPRNQYRASA